MLSFHISLYFDANIYTRPSKLACCVTCKRITCSVAECFCLHEVVCYIWGYIYHIVSYFCGSPGCHERYTLSRTINQSWMQTSRYGPCSHQIWDGQVTNTQTSVLSELALQIAGALQCIVGPTNTTTCVPSCSSFQTPTLAHSNVVA